jgi:transmembrane sensor
MNNEQLAAIIARIADNTATDEDLAAYNAWCNAQQEQDLELGDLSAIEAQTLRNIQRQTGHVRRFTLVRRIAAAALITGILAGSLYLYRYTNRPSSPHISAPAIATNNDISAGKNTATLTLANGKKIVLADSQDGKLTEEAGSQVTKTAEGRLEYHPGTAAAAVPQYNILNTARGEQYQITLSDGTKVWLNASTTLTFPASFANMATRKVTVTGEAYFEVAQDAAHPFIVNTGKQEVKVLGTHFNVNSYPDEPSVKTTLLQGAVKINNEKTLTPGQQAISSKDGTLKITTVSAEAVIAWKNGYFEFNDENIYDIMRKIARWYNVEVIYEGDIPMNGMEGAISRFENVSRVLNTIQKAGLLKFRIEQKKIYVSKY